MNKEKKCKQLVKGAYKSRIEDIRKMFEAEDQYTPELGKLAEYGLSIDIVEAGTFKNKRPYARYQLSWGGPSEEFRIGEDGTVKFWYLDWFDGASIEVTGKDADMIKQIVENSIGVNSFIIKYH